MKADVIQTSISLSERPAPNQGKLLGLQLQDMENHVQTHAKPGYHCCSQELVSHRLVTDGIAATCLPCATTLDTMNNAFAQGAQQENHPEDALFPLLSENNFECGLSDEDILAEMLALDLQWPLIV